MREAPSRLRRRRDPKVVGERAQRGAEALELLDVQFAQVLEAFGPLGGQLEPDLALVGPVGPAAHEPGGDRAVDELDRAVVAQQQVAGDVADRRTGRVVVAADREQQLVLRGGQTGGDGLPLAPAQEPAQAGPEAEQPRVVVMVERPLHAHIVALARSGP